MLSHDELQSRIEKLESSNRKMKRTLILSVAGLACAFFAGMRVNKFGEVQASRFVLLDECGATRATLDLDKGEPVLRMVGSGGQTQVQLGVIDIHNDSARLYLQNSTGSSFAYMDASSTVGSSGIEFGGSQKRMSAKTNHPGKNPKISLTNEAGDEIFHAP